MKRANEIEMAADIKCFHIVQTIIEKHPNSPSFSRFLFLVAQWSRRPATNRKIPGSSPGGEEYFFEHILP